ncbi:hypothetical protein PMW_203 [Pseudomonas phage phiPMW]|uniref:Uncharacterized protein n=1 Tax=Pseudomonas phage phiPMW TaxID=1815582 RepID=A0A1S5R1S6_9CAUD|nr:hypothetical protein FDG97_gp147 [Pseudomonas phage phiPMW]ANA49328.1 hypothetical protein PMW_203 [Pseudomonas phage phiPMW]
MSFNWPVLFCLFMTVIVSNSIIEATIKDNSVNIYKLLSAISIGILFNAAGFQTITVG